MQNRRNFIKLPPSNKRWGFILPNKKIFYALAFVLVFIVAIVLSYILTRPVRYVVFAGYNKDGVIEPYVVTYLKGLDEVCDGIVYIADSELKSGEEKKLDGINILYMEHKRHNEYDWGSYKRGYVWLRDNGYLDKAGSLILANDSTYAPITSFKPMFKEMEKRRDIDFWGASQNTQFTRHLQSYFLVFKKSVLKSRLIDPFIESVETKPDSSYYIVEYETKLTPYLQNLGYKWDSYMPYKKLEYLTMSDKNSYPLTIISKYNHQFLKRRTFTEKLMILESIEELLTYLKTNSPETYDNIMSAKHPRLEKGLLK